jgi:spore coat protein U-like protein
MPNKTVLRRCAVSAAAAAVSIGAALIGSAAAAGAAECSVSPGPLVFGDYSPLARTATKTAATTIKYSCRHMRDAIHVEVRVQGGLSGRVMKNLTAPGDVLLYDLYFNSTTRGTAPTGGDGTVFDGVLAADDRDDGPHANAKKLLIYGAIRPRQNVRAGSYADTVSVVIEFEF